MNDEIIDMGGTHELRVCDECESEFLVPIQAPFERCPSCKWGDDDE